MPDMTEGIRKQIVETIEQGQTCPHCGQVNDIPESTKLLVQAVVGQVLCQLNNMVAQQPGSKGCLPDNPVSVARKAE